MLVIHDSELKPVAILDNDKQGTLNYSREQWKRQLLTGSSVYEFTVYKKTIDGDNPIQHKYDILNDQAFVSFNHKGKIQMFNIMRIEEDEKEITCYCENLNLELLNEYCPDFKAQKAMSFEEYLIEFDMINFAGITIGVNEVKDKKLTLEWSATETKLARLLSIASNFDAEIEFETLFNNNYTFKQLLLNVYKKYEEGKSLGVGQDKTDRILRYHKNISGIKKTVDKREVYNAVKPVGKKKVTGTRVVSNPVTKKVTKLVTNRKTYVGGDLHLQDKVLKKEYVQLIIDYAVQYNILPSGLIAQLYNEALWGTSYVAKVDNNWGGLTWTGATTRPSGVTVSRGSARPISEGGYYMHFASMSDYFKDYTYLLAKQGIYNVVGKKTFLEFTRGLFPEGGAKYNYATIGYDRYQKAMDSIRSQINIKNSNILNTIDTIWKTPVTTTGTTVAKRATQTINVLNQIQGMKGHRIGSGQCYALSAWYAMKLNGPGLGGGVTGIRGLIGGGMAAALIGHDYNWGSYGWKVDKAPTASNLQAGGIYNIRANSGSPVFTGIYGHTGIIKSVTDTQVTVYEQNWGGRMYIVENVYNKAALVGAMSSVCYPREIKEGLSVTGATTQQISGGTQISYDEVVQEAQTETFEEEQIVTIDKSIYKEWKDADGKVEFYLKNGMFFAPLSKDRYPSVLSGNETRDNWIRKDIEVDTDSQTMLETVGLKDIKAHAYPIITYEVDGFIDVEIGDVVRIQDDGYKPPLLLTARVIEQIKSDTNKSLNKTTFSNIVEQESEISNDLVSEMLRMYDDATPYNIRLAVSNGTAFKNSIGESLLTPTLEKNGKEYDAIFAYRNGDSHLDMGPQLLVKAADFSHVLNVTVEAYLNDELVASAQVSFTDTEDGTDGVGVNSVSITYGLSKSASTQPTTWTTDLPVAGQGDYLWTRKITDYTDSAKEDTIELTYSFQGKDGVAGASLKVSKIEYQSGTSGTVAPSGAWTTTIPSVPEGQYLWSKTMLSDNSIVYGIAKQGATGPQGPRGADGIAGKDGVGISSTAIAYGLSANETTQPATWTANPPTLVKGQYLWTKTVWTYTDAKTETGYVKTYIAKDGNTGADGIPGKDGVGISSTTITYQGSTSGTATPTGTWVANPPSVPAGQFLWTKTVWTYTDGNSETGYSVSKMGDTGSKGSDGITYYPHTAYANKSKNILSDAMTGFETPSFYQGAVGTFKKTEFGYDFTTRGGTHQTKQVISFMNTTGKSVYTFFKVKNSHATNNLIINHNGIGATLNGGFANVTIKPNETYVGIRPAFCRDTYNFVQVSIWAENISDDLSYSIYEYALYNEPPFINFSFVPNNHDYLGYYTDASVNASTDITKYNWNKTKGALDEAQVAEMNSKIDSKADDALTTEQLQALADAQRIADADLKGKADLATVEAWVQALNDEIEARKSGQASSEQALIDASNRIIGLQQSLGEMQVRTDFVNTYMSESENGLVIGMKDGSSSVRVSNDRISFYSAGKETAYISQGVLQIESGIFTTKLQIGRFRIEQYEANPDMNVVRYVG